MHEGFDEFRPFCYTQIFVESKLQFVLQDCGNARSLFVVRHLKQVGLCTEDDNIDRGGVAFTNIRLLFILAHLHVIRLLDFLPKLIRHCVDFPLLRDFNENFRAINLPSHTILIQIIEKDGRVPVFIHFIVFLALLVPLSTIKLFFEIGCENDDVRVDHCGVRKLLLIEIRRHVYLGEEFLEHAVATNHEELVAVFNHITTRLRHGPIFPPKFLL